MARFEAKRLTDFQRALQGRIEGETRFDPYTQALYASDASNHLVTPLGVAFPRHEEDLFAIVETAAEMGVPVLPRGSGTSLSGASIGQALIIDCTRYLNRIHAIDAEKMEAEVGPGVVCNRLNAEAGAYGLVFGPDPASADRATLGGMIGNNSTGAHSIRYGMVADHVLALDVILSDGSAATFGGLSEEAAQAKSRAGTLEGRIYQNALEIRRRYAQVTRERWPRTWRRASGYSLNYLTGYTPGRPASWYLDPDPYPPQGGFNLAPLLCGSEGTLAIVRRARLRLVPKPAHRMLVVLSFESVPEACDFTPAILETEPDAIELIPRTLIEQARTVPAYARKLTFVEGAPAALLVVEYSGDSPEEALAAASTLAPRGRLLDNPDAQADLWAVRKAGLGLLMSVPSSKKPITFIEDVAVPVEMLGSYVRRVDEILEGHGTYGEWYAHASAGCLHLRPLIDLKTADGVRRMRSIADAVADLVFEMHGSISGEHGDGLSHTEFNARLFGPEIYGAFKAIKRAFDPKNLLNPGKIVVLEGSEPPALHINLRYGPSYSTSPVPTTFAFQKEGGFAGAVEACTGVGICRKEEGLMCPSFQATRDEMHTTRGRANALRAALSGLLPVEALTSERMYRVLDLCLECKGCKAECPTSVDMARVKAEFLAMYHAEHGLPLRSWFFGHIASISRLARAFAEPVNWVNGLAPFRRLMEATLGVSGRRSLPTFNRKGFRSQLARLQPHPSTVGEVVLFVDTYTESNVPEVGVAAVRVLNAAGYHVHVVENQGCCGRPMISKGLLDDAKARAARNLQALAPYAERGVPILGLEPSCLLTLRDEYLDFFPDDRRALAIASAARLIEEFLTENSPAGGRPVDSLRFRDGVAPISLHVHCHAKSLVGSSPMVEMLRSTGSQVVEIDSGCCGMAGSFGYEAEHYELSMEIGSQRLFPAVRDGAGHGRTIAAAGVSCRTQIRDGTGVLARHPIQILAEALESA